MIVMKKRFFLSALATGTIVALSMIVYNWFNKNNDDYLSAIPKNVNIAYKVNLGDLLNKSELLKEDFITENISMLTNDMPAELASMVNEIVKDPSSSGIDVDKDIVIALCDGGEKGVIVMAVKDVDNLKDNLSILLKESGAGATIKEDDDFFYIEFGSNSMAFDKHKLVVAADAKKCMNLKKDDQAISEESFKNWASRDSDISIMIGMEKIIDMIQQEEGTNIDMSLYKNMMAYIDLNFVNGAIELSLEVDGNEELKSLTKELYSEPKGEHLKYVPDNALAVFATNLSGSDKRVKTIAEMVNKMSPEAKDNVKVEDFIAAMNDELGFDIMQCLSNLNGDMTIAMLPFENFTGDIMPQFIGLISVDGREIFDMMEPVLATKFKEVDNDVYALGLNVVENYDYNYYSGRYETITTTEGYDYYIGYKNNLIFVMPQNIYASNGVRPFVNNLSGTEMAKMLNRTGYVFNISNIHNEMLIHKDKLFANNYNDMRYFEMISDYIGFVKYGSIKVVSPTKVELRLDLANKKNNALKQVVELVRTIVVEEVLNNNML